MKKAFSLCAVILLSQTLFAQDGIFVKAGIGAGTATSSFKPFSGDAYKNGMEILSRQAQLNIGYKMGKWQLETGIGYWQSGVSYYASGNVPGCGGPTYVQEQSTSAGAIKYTITNSHITVPAILGYSLNSKHKISFVPGIGVEALYNLNSKKTADANVPDYMLATDKYNKISAAAVVKYDIQYKVSKQVSVWCSPSYQNMISSFSSKIAGNI
jgi:hypothetical protein